MSERPSDSCDATVCGLSAEALRGRRALIARLLEREAQRLAPVTGGVLVEFRGGARIAAEVQALVALEAECCPFLTITVRASPDRIKLEVTGPPSAQPLISGLFRRSLDNK